MWLIRNGWPGKLRSLSTTRAVAVGPPMENAALILSGAAPGWRWTSRSRGIDITIEALARGFSRARMIVSEGEFLLSLRDFQRRSEPPMRMVCGPPALPPGTTEAERGMG